MLYKFQSQASGDVIMTERVGDAVLEAIGREPAAQGVILVDDMSEVIAKLEAAMAAAREREANPPEDEDKDNENYDPIPFYTRAQPFLNLLKNSLEERKAVVWGV